MNVSAGDAFNCRCLNPRPMCRLGAATAQAVPEFQCMYSKCPQWISWENLSYNYLTTRIDLPEERDDPTSIKRDWMILRLQSHKWAPRRTDKPWRKARMDHRIIYSLYYYISLLIILTKPKNKNHTKEKRTNSRSINPPGQRRMQFCSSAKELILAKLGQGWGPRGWRLTYHIHDLSICSLQDVARCDEGFKHIAVTICELNALKIFIEMYVVRMTCTGNPGIRRAMAQIPSGNNDRLKIFQLQSLVPWELDEAGGCAEFGNIWQPHGSCLQPQLQETLVVGILKGTSEIPFPDVSRVKAPTTPTPATANTGMAKWHALQHDGAGMNKLIHKRPICCHPFWDTNGHTWHYFIPAFTFNAGSAFNACTSLRGWSSGPQRAWRSGARKKTSWYTVMSRPLFPSISTNVFLFVSAFLYCCLVTGATIHKCHVLTVQWILLEGSLHRKSNRAMGGHTNKVPPFFPRHVSKCRRQADSGSAMYPWDSVCRKRPPTKMKQHNLMTIGKHMGEPVPPYLSKSIACCAYLYMFNYTARI